MNSFMAVILGARFRGCDGTGEEGFFGGKGRRLSMTGERRGERQCVPGTLIRLNLDRPGPGVPDSHDIKHNAHK